MKAAPVGGRGSYRQGRAIPPLVVDLFSLRQSQAEEKLLLRAKNAAAPQHRSSYTRPAALGEQGRPACPWGRIIRQGGTGGAVMQSFCHADV